MSFVEQFGAPITDAKRQAIANDLKNHEAVTQLLKAEAKNCPVCTASHEMLCIGGEEKFFASRFCVACVRCGHAGGYGLSIEGAVGQWNDESTLVARIFRSIRSIVPGYKETISLITPMNWY